MWNLVLAYISIVVVMLVLDAVWLGWLAKNFYRRGLSRAVVFEVRWWAAMFFYVLHPAGTLFFAVLGYEEVPAILLRGAFFGLVTYGTYNLTNLATVRHWPLGVALVDMVWGACLTMLAALAAATILYIM